MEIRRGGRVESVVRADGVVVDSAGRLVAWFGNPHRETYWRSSAKPFQAVPLVLSGAAAQFDLDVRDVAIAAASHSGEPRHFTRVERLLQRGGLTAADLACGADWPKHAPTADAMRRAGLEPSPLHHNCSGKHAGMLLTAAARGVATTGYVEPDHPVQQEIRQVVAQFTGVPAGDLATGVDGCGVPTFYLPLSRMAWAYARLYDGRGLADDQAAAGQMVAEAMRTHPELVSGEGRLEARLAEATDGRVMSKGGAEGLYCGALPERGWGVAVKVDDGGTRARRSLVAAVLSLLPVLAEEARMRLAALAVESIPNYAGRTIGEMMPIVELQWGQVR